MLSSCKCKRKCLDFIPQEQREIIYLHYWSSNRINQKEFLWQRISNAEKKRTRTKKSPKKNRRHSRVYTFKRSNDEMVQVCSIFFLGTLGYKNEHNVSYMFNQQSPTKSNKPDARGRHSPAHKLSEGTKELINKHIEAFNPSISHYRRAHAP